MCMYIVHTTHFPPFLLILACFLVFHPFCDVDEANTKIFRKMFIFFSEFEGFFLKKGFCEDFSQLGGGKGLSKFEHRGWNLNLNLQPEVSVDRWKLIFNVDCN